MQFFTELMSQLFGPGASRAGIAASFILVFLGAAINFLLEVKGRNPQSARSPVQFSLRFMLQDNWQRIGISVLFCFAAVIAGPAIKAAIFGNNNLPEGSSRFTDILLGLGSDYLPMRIKQRFFKDAEPYEEDMPAEK